MAADPTAPAPPVRARSARPRRYRETPDFAAMMVRMTRAYGRRVGNGDAANLPLLAELKAEVETALAAAVVANVVEHGYSWAEVGRELGITKQSAFQRYGKLVPADAARRVR